ncbi:unnamed protein product [Oncorhynchus mykiss]|nr:unnamed protein product [Oncorhynchus mykiss]
MSIIIVTFPGAPQVSQEALQKEAELETILEAKVEEIVNLLKSRDKDPDLLYVMKFLVSEDIPGLPPGGGVTSKRDCVISAYQKFVTPFRSLEPMVEDQT